MRSDPQAARHESRGSCESLARSLDDPEVNAGPENGLPGNPVGGG
jgi:hypothetical protein